jgi:hypothetical protein
MSKQIFTKTTLPTGLSAVIYEGYGRHWFHAQRMAQGDITQVVKYLLVALMEINGQPITEDDVDNLHIRDITFATEVLTSMMTNGVPGLPGY